MDFYPPVMPGQKSTYTRVQIVGASSVLAVAHAARVVLSGLENTESAMAGAMKIATQMSDAMSSTAQDLNRGKLTEIDSLNGFVSRRGLALGVPTPVNHALFTLVKLAEGR